jgi:transposase
MGAAKSPKRVLQYEESFKARAVQLSRVPGVRIKDVAESLDIHPYMLSRWRKQYREGRIGRCAKIEPDPKIVSELQRLRRLEREHTLLQEEHELLKKAIRFCSEERARNSRSSSGTGTGTASAGCVVSTESAELATTPGVVVPPVPVRGKTK